MIIVFRLLLAEDNLALDIMRMELMVMVMLLLVLLLVVLLLMLMVHMVELMLLLLLVVLVVMLVVVLDGMAALKIGLMMVEGAGGRAADFDDWGTGLKRGRESYGE